MTPADVLSRSVFTIDGQPVDWAAVIEAAKAWGDWAPLERSASPHAEVVLDEEAVRRAVEERATALRYDRRLLSADETQEWFENWGVTVAEWLDHIRRQVRGEEAPDPENAVWIEAITSGTLERAAWRLARELTAHRALGGSGWPTVEALSQAMSDFAQREAAAPDRRATIIAEHAIAWTLFDLQHVQLGDEATARELGSWMSEGGRPIEEVAAEAGLPVVATRTTLEDLPAELRTHLNGAAAGDVVGPVAVDGSWRVIAVGARTLPTDDDPQVEDRARKRVVAEALHREMARRVRWLDHVPPRSGGGTEALPDDASADERFHRPARPIRRFPTVWAVDEMDCGAACLATVCRYFGRSVPLTLVRDLVGTALDGTSLRGLVVGAERLGLAARPVKASPSRLDSMPLPAICHWQGDHWVVLHDTNERFVRVSDPVAGPRRIPRAEWLDSWSGYSCLVAPTPALQEAPEGRPPWRWLLPFVRPHRRAFAGATALALGAATLQMLVPVGAGLIVDEAITGGDRRLLHLFALGMLGVLLAAVGAGLVQRWLLARLAVRFDAAILDHVTDRLLGLPASYFAARRTGDIERRLGGLRQVRVFLVQQGVVGLTAVAQIAVALTIMVVISRRLSLVYLATVPLYVAAMVYSRRRLRPLLSSLEEAFGRYHSRQIDAIRGIETVKARGAEGALRTILRRQFDSLAGRVYRSDLAFMRYDAAVALVLFLTLALVLWAGGLLVLGGDLSIGELVAFNGLVLLANGPVGEVLRLWDEFQYASVLLGRLDDVLAQEPEQGADRSRLRPVPALGGRVSVEGLTVRTGGSPAVTILDDVTLEIEPGETVALVGFSGAGKTTLARCLLGLLPPSSGRILYDGADLDTLDHRQLRQRIGYVLQDDHLFDDTLAANIALGDDEIDDEAVRWAAGVADAAGFIERLPLGYETRVGETGVRLSGGQAQRVAIARAVYRRPAILILDEATSSLDADSERAVKQGIAALLGGRTQIVIAHRLSTVRDADRIVVLDHGRIVEQGTHAELLERRGLYWYMASQQVGD
ncbi:MAG: ATP-binding cassette, subfamily bacterial [Actinomycetota bacterium]|nr:ATP-binding cassette, subfamily bacterial [Actinomycetota bacterium]